MASILGGAPARVETDNADGSYDIQVNSPGAFFNLNYAYLINSYTAAGFRRLVTFYDVAGHVMATKSLTPSGGFTVTLNGALYEEKTVNADGTAALRINTAGNFYGVSYGFVVDSFNATGVRNLRTFYDVNGTVIGSKSISPNGSFAITFNGVVTRVKTVKADGSYDMRVNVGGSFYGVDFAFYDADYDKTGFRDSITFFDAEGKAVASKTFGRDGGYAVTLNGALYEQKFVNGNGGYQIVTNAPGVFYGVAYATSANTYDPKGALQIAVYEDADGNPLATDTAGPNGVHSVVLNVAPAAPLSAAEIAAIPSTDAPVWSNVTAAWLNSLAPDAVAALTAADLAAIRATTYSNVSVAFVANVSVAAISGLSADDILALSPAALAALSPVQLAALGAGQINALKAAQIIGFTPVFWSSAAWVSVAAVWLKNLSDGALSALPPAAVGSLPGSVVAALDLQSLSPLVIADLTPAQIPSLVPVQLSALDAAHWAAFSAAQLAAFPVSVANLIKIGNVSTAALSGWSIADIEAVPRITKSLTPKQFAALSAEQIAALAVSDPIFVQDLSPDDIAAISPGTIAALGAANLLKLSGARLAALTEDQINALTDAAPPGFWSNVPASWINGLSSFSLFRLDTIVAELQPATIAGLTLAAFGRLSPDVWSFFTPAQTAAVTSAQFHWGIVQTGFLFPYIAHPENLNVFVVSSFSPFLLAAFPAADFANFNAQWLNNLQLRAFLNLDGARISAIRSIYIPYLNPAIFGVLSPDQASNLTPDQVSAFTSDDFLAMSVSAAQAIPTADLVNLNASQLTGVDVGATFTADQIAASPALQFAQEKNWTTADIEKVGIANLTIGQILALSPNQLVRLPQADIQKFSLVQVLSMSAEQLAAIKNFLPYSTLLEFRIAAITATPTQLLSYGANWTLTSYGAGTLGDSVLWPHFTVQQVAALAARIEDIFIGAGETFLSGHGEPNAGQANELFDDVLSLSDAAFAGLAQSALQFYPLAGLMELSYTLRRPLTAGEIDSVAPSQWVGALQFLQSQGDEFLNAAAYFDDNATNSAYFAYQLSQDLSAFEAWSSSHNLNSLTDDQLAVLNSRSAPIISLAQIESLSAGQFAALYPNLSTSQVENLLFDEIKALPAAAQAKFYNGGNLNGDLQDLLNPAATANQLFSSAFTTADQINAQNFIDIYDQNYAQIAANPTGFEEFTKFYNLLETRSNTLIANATVAAQITAEVNAILLGFTQYNTALVQNPPNAGNNTSLDDYLTSVASQLTGVGAGLTTLQSDLTALGQTLKNVLGLVLDNTTEATPLAAYTQWALDGSPNAATPAGKGVLTYNGQTGLTFQQALEEVEYALFSNADDFVSNALAAAAEVAQAQSAAEVQKQINDILLVVSAVSSFGAGAGGLLSAFSETFGAAATLAGNLTKVVNTLGAISYFVPTSQGLAAEFGATDSSGNFTNLSAAGGEMAAVVNNITSYLTSGDAYAQAAIQKAGQFAVNYQKLFDKIMSSLGSGTSLGQQSTETGDAHLDAALRNIVANTGTSTVGDVPGDIWRFQTVRNMPTQDLITFTGADGHSYNVNLNLAQIFGVNPDSFASNPDVTLFAKGNHNGNILEPARWYSARGPDIFGYASTSVQIELVESDSNLPSHGSFWDLATVRLVGINPKA